MRKLLCALIVLAWALPAHAATIVVRQNGTGDFTTIAAAIAAATDGDEIRIGTGEYHEHLLVMKVLALVAEDGPGTVVLNGDWSSAWILQIGYQAKYASPVRVAGLTFTGGNSPDGGSAIFSNQDVIIEDCVFTNNLGGAVAAIVHVRRCNATVRRCTFEGNGCTAFGSLGPSTTIENCTFRNNHAGVKAGAVAISGATQLTIANCLFWHNESTGTGGAIEIYNTPGTVSNNTFFDNAGPRGTVRLYGASTAFTNNIVAAGRVGYGLWVDSDWGVSVGCNLFFNNAVGDVYPASFATGNRFADPLFCDTASGDFQISATSPAMPDASSCGLVGAFAMGCSGPVPIEATSWGSLKSQFR